VIVMAEHDHPQAEAVPESIPIQNLYYLLCYAWGYLKQGRPIPMPAGECQNLTNLFALILERGIRHEVRRGIHREYVEMREETPRLRGRLVMRESMKRQTWQRGRMVCQFDELSHDVLPNQIIKATGARLLQNASLSLENRKKLRQQLKWFAQVAPIKVSSRHFRQIQVHRRNRTYRFLLSLCELLHRMQLPGEGDASTQDKLLRSILRDEIVLCSLFETFVRNFYAEHLKGCRVKDNWLKWDGFGLDEISDRMLPGLHTDVTIDGPDTRIILDCKFYQNALAGGQVVDKVIGAHLFQLLAYLQNARQTFRNWSEGQEPRGILLYPAVQKSFDLRYQLMGLDIQVCSVNLDQPWQKISAQLLTLTKSSATIHPNVSTSAE